MKRNMAIILLAMVLLGSGATTAYAEEDYSTVVQLDDVIVTDTASQLLEPSGPGPTLRDVRIVEQGGQTLMVKTWDIPPDYNPDLLMEQDFEKGGLQYTGAYLLFVSENNDRETKLASETITVDHDQKDGALAKLPAIIEYDRDGFRGQLTLSADAIVTEAADQSSYTYAVTDTRIFSGLERNDTFGIPKSVSKNGAALQLTDISWAQMGEGNYTATASYLGTASGVRTTGYLSTATYMGEVARDVPESLTYAAVYEGSAIPAPPVDYLPYALSVAAALVILVGGYLLLNRKPNTKVFAMEGKEYQLVHRQRLSPLAPIIDLSSEEIQGDCGEFMVVLSRWAIRKMRGHCVKIIGPDGLMKEQRIYKVRHFRIGSNNDLEDS